MSARWEQIGAARYFGGAIKIAVGLDQFVITAEDAPAFVKVGDKVTKGQTILLIEAMKTFNQIHATHDGTVKQILVGNADPVEFNQPLMIIE